MKLVLFTMQEVAASCRFAPGEPDSRCAYSRCASLLQASGNSFLLSSLPVSRR